MVEFESLVVAPSRLWPYDAIMLLVLRLFLPSVLLALFPRSLSHGHSAVHGLVPVPQLELRMYYVERLVDGEHVRAGHLEVIPDWQPRVPDALLVGLIQSQVLVPVPVHDAPDDVHLVILEVLELVFAVRGEVHQVCFALRQRG